MVDPEFLRLYRRYVASMRAYEILLKNREETRARARARRASTQAARRPIGAPESTQVSQTTDAGTSEQTGKKPGWTWSTQDGRFGETIEPMDEREIYSKFGYLELHEKIEIELFIQAREYYEKCKKEFFDYARRRAPEQKVRPPSKSYQKNLNRAKGYAQDAASQQWLGLDEAADLTIKNIENEVENACYTLWDNIQNDPSNRERFMELIQDGLLNAQLVGIENSPIVQIIQQEVDRRFSGEK
jgi:hypothetical protein